MNTFARAAFTVALMLWAAPLMVAWAGDTTPRVALPLMDKAPVIDGGIGEEEWAGAVRNIGFVGHGSGGVLVQREAVFWVGCDGKQLYVAVKTEAPPDGKILIATMPDGKRDLIGAFNDDSIELALDPKRGRPTGDRTYYHLIVNANEALYDRSLNPDNPQNQSDFNWRIEGWTFRSQVKDGWWQVEMAFPLASLGANADDLKQPWGVRIARNWKRPGPQSQWESQSVAYDDQGTMPVVTWDAQAPVVQVLSLHKDEKQASIEVSVRNPHKEPLTVAAHISNAWHQDQPTELNEQVAVPAGQTRTLTLASRDGGEAGLHHTVIAITSPDGQKVYYFRDFRWGLHRPASVWDIGEEKAKPVDMKFKYYPYYSKIRLRVDIGKMPQKDRVTGAVAEIRTIDMLGKVADRAVWSRELAFTKFVSEGVYDVPDFNDGRHRLSVRFAGEGVPADAETQDFVRIHYDWERNKLGVADEVMPPFTPMEARENVVRCVLREHAHGPTGLWDSVTSEGRPLLTGPMRWEVVAAAPGQQPAPQEVRGEGWKCLSATPTAVTGEAGWSAGPVRAHVRTDYDYDGMMLVTLTLEPTGEAAVQRLSLVIPVTDAEARYMHAVSDSLRHHYAGFVPQGQGKLWDSNKANKIDLIGTFFPYLWVGGGERGLCWFADTDRDWLLDDATPVLELARDGATLQMRVNFVTRPGPLAGQRSIVFGLQATPTKPMPEGWRRWTARKSVPGGRCISWMGACMYWGAPYFGIYPLDKRFELYREFARERTTGQTDPAFVPRWMSYVEQIYPKDSDDYKSLLAHINAGCWVAKSSPWKDVRLFGYTNARGCCFREPEFATFQDEWLRFDWFGRNWDERGCIAYDVSPSESFVDYAVWYYRRMLECFDGVYWDNVYLSPNYDPVVGSAWVDEKGRTHPGLGLLHLRDLVKRTAIMHWQEGRNLPAFRQPFLQLSHMTNTMIVPVLSFGNCNMDWEWKYGFDDFQDRFSADMTVAETIGRQVGASPTILGGGNLDPKDPRTVWAWRTRMGICLVHEIQHYDYGMPGEVELYRKLFEFGYGEPDCRVFNYWDAPHPVSVKSDTVDARTIAVARGGAAIVVVTDYGKGGDCVVKLDRAALGLGAEAKAVNMETGAAVAAVAPGEFAVTLKKHDFAVLKVQSP